MTRQHADGPDQEEILAGLRRGDAEACRIVAAWARRSVTQPRFAVPRDDVEDLVQDALAQVILIIRNPGFVVHTSLQALVRRVAMARSVDAARRRRPMVELPPELRGADGDHADHLARREELDRVREALAELTDLCRDLIRWFYLEEQAYRVIAERTGRNINTLRVHMFKCLQHLRKSLVM